MRLSAVSELKKSHTVDVAECGRSHLLLLRSTGRILAQHPVSPADVGWRRGSTR